MMIVQKPVITATPASPSQRLESETSLFLGLVEEVLEFVGDPSRELPLGSVPPEGAYSRCDPVTPSSAPLPCFPEHLPSQ